MQAVRPTIINYNIPHQLQQVADIGGLINRFQIIPDAQKFTTQTVWNRTHALGTLVLGLLTAYAYKQAQKNIAIALGVLAGMHLLKIRVSTKVDSPEYAAQKAEIHQVFCGLIPQLQEMHRIISEKVVEAVNRGNIDNLNDAKAMAAQQVREYTQTPKASKNPSMEDMWQINAQRSIQSANQFVHLRDLDAINDLNPLLKEEIKKIMPAVQQFVYGRAPQEGEHPDQISYVELALQGDEGNQQAAARAWSAAPRA